MILTRLGNKRKMKTYLAKHFPPHKMRIELFFGAGGSYFYLPKPKYAILNDFDDDVTNLYLVVQHQKEDFIHQLKIMPVSQNLLKYWLKNKETDPLKKAIRFMFLSNFTYMGKGNILRLGLDNVKKNIINNIEKTLLYLQDVKLTNVDFREVLPKISFSKSVLSKDDSFCYLDPVYLDTEHWYKVPKWTVRDTEDCFKLMQSCGIRCAMSEFDHEKVLDFASDYNMNVIQLKDRKNIKNVRREILVTNYKPEMTLF